MKKLTLAAGLAIIATGATALYAAPAAKRGDADGNGTISRAEAQAQVSEMFAKADANGDGRIDPADRAAMQAKMFDTIDTDKNGSLSRAEFDAHHAGMGKGGMRGHRMGGRGMGGGMLRMADANNDGAVTRDEATAAAMKHFDMVDTSKDGQISKEERRAAMGAMRGKRGGDAMATPPADDDDGM